MTFQAPDVFRCSRDLYQFFFELMMKGFALLYGTAQPLPESLSSSPGAPIKMSIDVRALTTDQVFYVKNRLRYAGIGMHFQPLPATTPMFEGWFQPHAPEYIQSMQVMQRTNKELLQTSDHAPLEEFRFYFKMEDIIYQIYFEVLRQGVV